MWAKFDDKYIYHPKIQEAGFAAQCVDMRGIIYCAGQETDGVMNLSALPTLLGDIPRWRSHVKKLCEVDRWHVQGHCCESCVQPSSTQYVIHDFLKFNLSHEKCELEREKARERMARSRGSSGRTEDVTSAGSSGARANGTGLSSESAADFCDKCGQTGWVPDFDSIPRTSRRCECNPEKLFRSVG
jgi:hypothetical protein